MDVTWQRRGRILFCVMKNFLCSVGLRAAVFVGALATSLALFAQESPPLPAPKPVPRLQVIPQPYHQVSFQRGGIELGRYHYGPTLHRPFVFPLIGPAGASVTRLGHPRDPESHSHHNSAWLAHHDVNGVSFWADRGTNAGRIIHQRIELLEDGDDLAFIQTINAWTDPRGTVLLQERRRTAVKLLPNHEWWLLVDSQFEAKQPEVVFGKTPFGFAAVRLAKTIGVHDGGGMIRNSAGGVNEKGVFWQPARWVDYSGLIAPNVLAGATLLDHPKNLGHPATFHVRDDGWMGAAFTFSAPLTLRSGESLRVRYGIYVHAGRPAAAALQQQWEAFAREPWPGLEPPGKKK